MLSLPTCTSPSQAVTNDSDDSDDEEKYADQADMAGTKFDPKTRTTVRNLRIREDTAKYLYNLDPNSAYYDPKTRSMRENPFQNSSKESLQAKFAGDNFVRKGGDVKDFARSQSKPASPHSILQSLYIKYIPVVLLCVSVFCLKARLPPG